MSFSKVGFLMIFFNNSTFLELRYQKFFRFCQQILQSKKDDGPFFNLFFTCAILPFTNFKVILTTIKIPDVFYEQPLFAHTILFCGMPNPKENTLDAIVLF